MIAKVYEEVCRIALEEFGTLSGVTISISINNDTGQVDYCLSR